MVHDTAYNQYWGLTIGMGGGAVKWDAVFAIFGLEQVFDGVGMDCWATVGSSDAAVYWHVE
jgi:hypothetical protein